MKKTIAFLLIIFSILMFALLSGCNSWNIVVTRTPVERKEISPYVERVMIDAIEHSRVISISKEESKKRVLIEIDTVSDNLFWKWIIEHGFKNAK